MIKKITKKQPTSAKRKELMKEVEKVVTKKKIIEDKMERITRENLFKYNKPQWETEKVTWESDMRKDERRTGIMILIIVVVLAIGWWKLSGN